MTSHRLPTLILDLGSHSAKAYLYDGYLIEVATHSWTLLEVPNVGSVIDLTLTDLVKRYGTHCRKRIAIGTEAMRRSPALAKLIQAKCESMEVSYRTLSHAEEASLIDRALGSQLPGDRINVGGGSIQIIPAASEEHQLLEFGISDLNRKFQLSSHNPQERKVDLCVNWIAPQLTSLTQPFVYTGGEYKYLRQWGVPILNHRCLATDFIPFANKLALLSTQDLEANSPFDPKWMRGSVASNCIVLAALQKSGATHFYPSDLNISHGLATVLAEQDLN